MTSRKSALSDQTKNVSVFAKIIKQFRLVWALFGDARVSIWAKSILPLALLYLASPIDFLPDVLLGLGQLDDLGVILLGMTLFVQLCPEDVVAYHRSRLEQEAGGHVIEAAYRQIDEDEQAATNE